MNNNDKVDYMFFFFYLGYKNIFEYLPSDTVLPPSTCITSFSSPSNPLCIICHTADSRHWGLEIRYLRGYTLASRRAQGYLTPEPRFLVFLLDFCWYNVYRKHFQRMLFHLPSPLGESIYFYGLVLLYTDDFKICISAHILLLFQI